MNRQIRETLTASEGRYLTPGEAKIVRSFAQRLDKSLTAVEDLEAKEDAIVDLALREEAAHVLRKAPDDDTALYLVMIIGARGLTGSDHVDGEEPRE